MVPEKDTKISNEAQPQSIHPQGELMKKLTLSQTDKKIAGVCGGLGEYFDIDPTIVRLAVVAVGLITAVIPVTIGYLIAWMVIPQKPAS
jgi:phage shock protein PspC (stress-responsive transcriptional regulator)